MANDRTMEEVEIDIADPEIDVYELDLADVSLLGEEVAAELAETTLMICGCGVVYAIGAEVDDERLLEVCPDCIES